MVACVVFSIAAIWTYAPVDNPNKPITKEERRMKFKKESIASAFIISMVSVALFSLHLIIGRINWLLPVSLAIFTGMAWQSFTLLKSGRWLISRMDGCFCALIKPKGGEVE
jgi:archaellum biogenesis protein FlaJ (TadC family)